MTNHSPHDSKTVSYHRVRRPTRHIIGHLETIFPDNYLTGAKTDLSNQSFGWY